MKILLLGDYSNFHPCLATALTRMGHEVTVASDGCKWMDTRRAMDLSRHIKGPLGGALLFMRMLASRQLEGYDVVSLINPSFVTLKPSRLRVLFDRLKKRNGAVFLNACGTDKAYMDMVTATDCPLRYTEYRNPDGSPNPANASTLAADRLWQQGEIADFCEYVYDNVDGVTTALYEYHLAMQRRFPADKIAYTGIPVDTSAVVPVDREFMSDGRVNLFLGRDRFRMAFKGTDRIGRAAARLADELPDKCRLTLVENVPYAQYIKAANSADLVLDQLYSFTPATNALLAMARGQAVLSGAEPEFYDFIGEKENFPIINAVPHDEALYGTLVDLVLQPELIAAASMQGREFVVKHNDAMVVAQRCLDFWQSRMK